MSADMGQIGLAVTEAQAVLELVAERLSDDKPLTTHRALTLFGAISAAIERLDAVHDILEETVEPAPFAVTIVESLQ